MLKVINFIRKGVARFQGRNGTFKQDGLEIMSSEHRDAISLTPITSKGVPANCQVEILNEEVPVAAFWMLTALGKENQNLNAALPELVYCNTTGHLVCIYGYLSCGAGGNIVTRATLLLGCASQFAAVVGCRADEVSYTIITKSQSREGMVALWLETKEVPAGTRRLDKTIGEYFEG